jgi:hypothetical protein
MRVEALETRNSDYCRRVEALETRTLILLRKGLRHSKPNMLLRTKNKGSITNTLEPRRRIEAEG